MKLSNLQTLIKPKVGHSANKFHAKVSSLCFSPDNQHLAVATLDRIISIFDTSTGCCIDKFTTKANSGGPKDYLVRSVIIKIESHYWCQILFNF